MFQLHLEIDWGHFGHKKFDLSLPKFETRNSSNSSIAAPMSAQHRKTSKRTRAPDDESLAPDDEQAVHTVASSRLLSLSLSLSLSSSRTSIPELLSIAAIPELYVLSLSVSSILLTAVCALPECYLHESSRCLLISSPLSASQSPSTLPLSAARPQPVPLSLFPERCLRTS